MNSSVKYSGGLGINPSSWVSPDMGNMLLSRWMIPAPPLNLSSVIAEALRNAQAGPAKATAHSIPSVVFGRKIKMK